MDHKQLRLTGAYKGADVAVGSIQFIKGVSQRLSEADAAAAMTFVPGRLDGLECEIIDTKPKKAATSGTPKKRARSRRR